MAGNTLSIIRSCTAAMFCLFVFAFSPTTTNSAMVMNTSFTQATSTLNWGLKAYWPFDGKDCGPTYCLDKNPNAGTKYNGIINGGVTRVPGKLDQALRFNGQNGYINTGAALFPASTDFTATLWFKTSAGGVGPDGSYPLIAQYNWGDGRAYPLEFGRTAKKIGVFLGGLHVTGVTDFSLDSWHMATVTRSGTTYTLYLDGVYDNDGTLSGAIAVDVNTSIGGELPGYNNIYTPATIDGVRIYSRVLSAAEIQQLYNQGAQKKATTMNKTAAKTTLENDASLVGWWPFNFADITGSWALDRSPSANKATTTGATAVTGKLGQGLSFNPPSVSGLVSHWTMDSNRVVGTSLLDAVGYATGTISGATSAGGKIEQALSFSGSNSVTGSANISNASDNFTMAGWVYWNGMDGLAQVIFYNGNPNNDNGYGFLISAYNCSTDGPHLNFYVGSSAGSTCDVINNYGAPSNTNYYLPTGRWVHIAGVRDATVWKLYADGNREFATVNNVTYAPDAPGPGFGIGSMPDGGGKFRGLIDDFRFYERALSAAEIKTLATASPPGLVVSPVASLNSFTALSVGAWVKYTSFTGTQVIMQKADTATSSSAYILKSNGSNFQFTIGTTTPITITSTTAIVANKWYYVMGTADGSNMRLYVNGTQEASATQSGTIDTMNNSKSNYTSSLFIGSNEAPGNFFRGTLDDPRIYSRALSANEIQQLYNQGAQKKATTMNTTPTKTTLENDTSLVGWWTMDGKDIYGTTVLDKNPGTKNNGTKTGTLSVSGKLGQALRFNGSSDNVGVTMTSTMNPRTGNYSISAWFKTLTTGTRQAIMAKRGTGSGNSLAVLDIMTDDKLHVLYRDGDGDAAEVSGSGNVVTDGKWHHAVGVRSGTTASLYFDGSFVSSATNASLGDIDLTNSCSIFPIGVYHNSDNCTDPLFYFNGSIDDVRNYNRALSAAEVQTLYKYGR